MTSRVACTATRDAKVGERGFEPPTSRTRTVRASLAALLPDDAWNYTHLCATMQISTALTLSCPRCSMTATHDSDLAGLRFDGIIGIEDDAAARTRTRTVERLTYRIFIGIVSLNALIVLIGLYLIPLPEPAKEVLWIVDALNALIFLARLLPPALHQPEKGALLSSSSGAGSISRQPAAPPAAPAASHPAQLRPLVPAGAQHR